MRVATVCGSCHEFYRGDPSDHPCSHRMKRSDGVQIGMIDGEQIGYFPPEAGPYVDPGNSIRRVLKNNYTWSEMIKRSEGKIGDVS